MLPSRHLTKLVLHVERSTGKLYTSPTYQPREKGSPFPPHPVPFRAVQFSSPAGTMQDIRIEPNGIENLDRGGGGQHH